MHYEGDQFHPNENEDNFVEDPYIKNIDAMLDDDITYVTQTSTVATNFRGKNNKFSNDYKTLDKGYRSLIRIVNGKKVKIQMYVTSYNPGTMIRDAVSGVRTTGFRVGSSNEDYFFKVKLATGELGRDAGHLYFETPSQCEKYLRLKLSDAVKQKWKSKYELYCKRNKL